MARIVPLIRAGAIGPIVEWMEQNDLSVSGRLSSVGLGWLTIGQPMPPIPLLPAVVVLKDLCEEYGPDLPFRIAADTGIFGIGMLGSMALSAATVRAALQNISVSMNRHCTHEIITVRSIAGGCIVSDHWATPLEDHAAKHYVQQYVAAIILSLVRLACCESERFSSVCLSPAGLGHLTRWFGEPLEVAKQGALRIVIPASVANLS